MRTIINNLKKVLPILAIPFFYSAKCNKDGSSCGSNITTYNFNADIQVLPQREIYKIGDTIFVESEFNKLLKDNITGSNIDYSNSVGIDGSLGINFIDTVNKKLIGARDNFTQVNLAGNFSNYPSNAPTGLNTNYVELINSYKLRCGLVCLKSGIFSFGVGDIYGQGIKGKDCTYAGFNVNYLNTDRHLTLYKSALGVTPDINNRIYCFRVQ